MEFTPKDESEIEEYMSFTALMKSEVDRINNIITEFLGFSKPFALKKTAFSIDDFLNDSIKLFISEASEKGVKLELTNNRKNYSFYGDQDKLTQVVVNLIKNSIDAVDENGRIIVTSSIIKNSKWLFSIEDNGIGIPKAKKDHIFDIYFTTKQNGTGLGLYVSRKIVLGHDGSIRYSESKLGGTRVDVEIPFQTT